MKFRLVSYQRLWARMSPRTYNFRNEGTLTLWFGLLGDVILEAL